MKRVYVISSQRRSAMDWAERNQIDSKSVVHITSLRGLMGAPHGLTYYVADGGYRLDGWPAIERHLMMYQAVPWLKV